MTARSSTETPASKQQLGVWIIPLSLAAGSTVWQLRWLLSWPVPVGLDGYYYLVQVESLNQFGHVYYPTTSWLSLRVIAFFAAVSIDPIVGVKVASALASGLLVLTTYFILHLLADRRCAILSASLVAISSLHRVFVAEFVANLYGILFFALLLLVLTRTRTTRSSQYRFLCAVVVAGCVLSHRSAAVLAALLVISYTIAPFICRLRHRWLEIMSIVTLAVTLSVRVVAAVAPVFWNRVAGDIRIVPRLPFWGHAFVPEAVLLSIAVPVVLWRTTRVASEAPPSGARDIQVRVLIAISLTAAAVALNPWANYSSGGSGAAERLGLWSFFFAAVLAPIGILRRDFGVFGYLPKPAIIALVVLALGAEAKPRAAVGIQPALLRERAQLQTEIGRLRGMIPNAAVVIAPHGYQFMVTHELRVKSSSRRSEAAASNARYWLVRMRGMRGPTDATVIHLSEWMLARDDDFASWFNRLSGPQVRNLVAQNPHIDGEMVAARFRASNSS